MPIALGNVTVVPILKETLREDIPLKRTKIHGNRYYECVYCSLSPKDTSQIKTELFGKKGILITMITGGPLYIILVLHTVLHIYWLTYY